MQNDNVVLIGGGSSVSEGRELGLWDKLASAKIFLEIWSINFAYKTMPYLPTREIWVDSQFFRNNLNSLEALCKQGVKCHAKVHGMYNAIPEIIQHKCSRAEFQANDMLTNDKIFTGYMGLSGMFALSLAYAMKFKNIYLLGYDFGTSSINDTRTHYYQDDKIDYVSAGVRNPNVYMGKTGAKKEVAEFNKFVNPQYNIFNVSTKSHITAFPKLTYQEFFNKIA